MRFLFGFVFFAMTVLAVAVEARMYQWIDAETGTTQLSGKPPAWYRTGQIGPRIFVFESGQLVDDTGIRVSEEQRELLRERSFNIANEEIMREKAKQQLLSKRQADDEPESASLEEEVEEVAEVEVELEEVEPDTITGDDISDLTAEDMRELILEWEQTQRDRAREIISQ